MSDEDYNGPERRKDAIKNEHRVTILEMIAERNKSGIETLNARFTQFDHEQKAEIRIGFETLREDIKELMAAQAAKCATHAARLDAVEQFKIKCYAVWSTIKTIAGWSIPVVPALGALFYKFVHHADKAEHVDKIFKLGGK